MRVMYTLTALVATVLPLGDWAHCDETSRDEAMSFILRAQSAIESGDLANAIELLTKAVASARNWTKPYESRADVYSLQRRTRLAVADYTKAIELSSHPARLYCKRAEAELAIQDYDQALRDAQRNHFSTQVVGGS